MKIYFDWKSLKHLVPPLLIVGGFLTMCFGVAYFGDKWIKDAEKEHNENVERIVKKIASREH